MRSSSARATKAQERGKLPPPSTSALLFLVAGHHPVCHCVTLCKILPHLPHHPQHAMRHHPVCFAMLASLLPRPGSPHHVVHLHATCCNCLSAAKPDLSAAEPHQPLPLPRLLLASHAVLASSAAAPRQLILDWSVLILWPATCRLSCPQTLTLPCPGSSCQVGHLQATLGWPLCCCAEPLAGHAVPTPSAAECPACGGHLQLMLPCQPLCYCAGHLQAAPCQPLLLSCP